jgi:hypothetical protein
VLDATIINLSTRGSVLAFDIAMDQDGDLVAVWYQNAAINARALSATGTLGPIQPVATIGSDPKVAVDKNGDALIVWDGIINGIRGRARSAAGVLSAEQPISTATNVDKPDVGMDSVGNALVAWAEYPSSGQPAIKLRRRAAAGALAAIQTLSRSTERSEEPKLAMAPNGEAVVAWMRDGSGTSKDQVQGRRRSAAGILSPIVNLSAVANEARYHQAVIDPDGDALVVWSLQTTTLVAQTAEVP